MINNTLSLGTVSVTYTKRFEQEGKSLFSVAGLTPNTQKVLNIGHEVSRNGKQISTLAGLTRTFVDPASATGQTADCRVQLVIRRPDFVSLADVKIAIDEMKTLLGQSTVVDQLLNQEV
jgi:hypothetical protein